MSAADERAALLRIAETSVTEIPGFAFGIRQAEKMDARVNFWRSICECGEVGDPLPIVMAQAAARQHWMAKHWEEAP